MAASSAAHLRRAVLPGLAAVVAMAAAILLMFNATGARAADAPVGLGTASGFSVLAGTTVTNTGASSLAQSLGVHPGTAAPGFPPGVVGGETHLGDAVALQASGDLTAAYNDAGGRTPFTSLASELGGVTLVPGVYRIGAAQLTGTLTLNTQGSPESVFIFQISSTLITASNSSVSFINGTSPCNVFWQIGSSATLGTGTSFVGNLMASTSITMATGASLNGRALARTGAVTLDNNTISRPQCLQSTAGPTASSTGSATASATAAATTTSLATTSPSTTEPGGSPTTGVLPTTDGGPAVILAGMGIVLAIVGAAVLLLYRRRSAS